MLALENYTYPATGSHQVTVVSGTTTRPVSLTIPVLVCQRIDVVDGDVRCTAAR